MGGGRGGGADITFGKNRLARGEMREEEGQSDRKRVGSGGSGVNTCRRARRTLHSGRVTQERGDNVDMLRVFL